MKRIFCVIVSVLMLCALCLPAFAADAPEVEETPVVAETEAPALLYTSAVVDELPTAETAFDDAVMALFGSYNPRTQTVTEYYADGSSVSYTQVIPGLAGLDWSWIAAFVLFALSLFCIFRMIGGIFKWK